MDLLYSGCTFCNSGWSSVCTWQLVTVQHYQGNAYIFKITFILNYSMSFFILMLSSLESGPSDLLHKWRYELDLLHPAICFKVADALTLKIPGGNPMWLRFLKAIFFGRFTQCCKEAFLFWATFCNKYRKTKKYFFKKPLHELNPFFYLLNTEKKRRNPQFKNRHSMCIAIIVHSYLWIRI